LTKSYEQNFLGEGENASFPFVRSFRQSNMNSKVSEKNQKFRRGGGVNDLGVWKAWGVEHFEISEGNGV